ncbi:MAG: ATP-binding protein, partial [Cyanobacteria bacterium J06633_2]
IPEEIKTKIFDPFFTTKKVGQGTGLGLGICFKIIQQHQGSIEIKSEVGEGSEFIITLPKTLGNVLQNCSNGQQQ